MKIKVIGKAHREGVSKKSGNPYNFNQVHYNGPDRGVEGMAALTLNLDLSHCEAPHPCADWGVKCRGCRYRPWCYLFRSRPPPPPPSPKRTRKRR